MNINGLTKNKILQFEFLLLEANEQQLPALAKMVENEIRKRQMISEANLFDNEVEEDG